MAKGPLSKPYGRYRIEFRKSDHTSGRPTPHVHIYRGSQFVGRFDLASGKALFKQEKHVPNDIQEAISEYLRDPQVVKKVMEAIETSFFDLSKPAGDYGGIPRGFKVVVSVEYKEPGS